MSLSRSCEPHETATDPAAPRVLIGNRRERSRSAGPARGPFYNGRMKRDLQPQDSDRWRRLAATMRDVDVAYRLLPTPIKALLWLVPLYLAERLGVTLPSRP